ncbi:MAG: amino acid ABC transporter permease, partial [Lachnospiraceae bacterium]|nr:amino acid ABC transporter permease [Lachnospiraceae bacterium]
MQAWFESVANKFEMAFVTGDRWKLYFSGLGMTLEIAFFAAILGMIIGTIVALMKLSTNKKGKKTIWARIANAYIDVIRGTPSV